MIITLRKGCRFYYSLLNASFWFTRKSVRDVPVSDLPVLELYAGFALTYLRALATVCELLFRTITR